MLKCTEC